jgi:hypothetical protein
MTNVCMKVEDDILTITVNLKERHGRSQSGKTEIIATTGGNVSSPSDPAIKIGLNVYSK